MLIAHSNMNNEIQLLSKEIEPIIESAQKMSAVETQEDYTMASDYLKVIKNKYKNIEDKRKQWTKPLDEAKKAIMDDVKTLLSPLLDLEDKLKSLMLDFAVKEKKRLAEEQRLIDEEAKEKMRETGELYMEVKNVEEDMKTKRGNISTATVKESVSFEVIDESIIPREYLVLDEKKVLADIKIGKEIPGIKKTKKETIAIR